MDKIEELLKLRRAGAARYRSGQLIATNSSPRAMGAILHYFLSAEAQHEADLIREREIFKQLRERALTSPRR